MSKNREAAEAQRKVADDAKLKLTAVTNETSVLEKELRGKQQAITDDQKNRAIQQQRDAVNFENAGTSAMKLMVRQAPACARSHAADCCFEMDPFRLSGDRRPVASLESRHRRMLASS